MATWAGEFSRRGPGLLLRDMERGDFADALGPILDAAPDVLLLTDFDYDYDLLALGEPARRISVGTPASR